MQLRSLLRDAAQPLLGHLSFSLPARTDTGRVRVPVVCGTGLGVFDQVRRGAETWKISLYRSLLQRRDGVFLDVGANLGQTLIQVRQVDTERAYVGFEPNPSCIGYVDKLVQLNGYRNVELLSVGIGETCGTASLHLPSGRSTDSTATLIRDLRPRVEQQARPVAILHERQLDGVIAGREVAAIKIDVEGAELEVLLGLRQLLLGERPPVLCEVLFADPGANIDAVDRRNRELMHLLGALDFEVYRIQKSADGQRIESLLRVREFAREYYTSANADLCDYLFLPAETAPEICATILDD